MNSIPFSDVCQLNRELELDNSKANRALRCTDPIFCDSAAPSSRRSSRSRPTAHPSNSCALLFM
jgi:hypothetical protein